MAKLNSGTRIFGTANVDSTLVVGAVSPQSPSVSSNVGTLQVGSPLNWSDTGIVGTFQANTNSYVQLVVQNSNTGTLSSADFIVSNDTSGTTVYGDFGINSTTSNNPSDPFGDPNGTYLYSSGGSLAQGTLSAFDYDIVTNNTIRLTANGTTGNISTTSNVSITSSTLKANATFVLGNTSTTNTASLVYNASVNSIDFNFN